MTRSRLCWAIVACSVLYVIAGLLIDWPWYCDVLVGLAVIAATVASRYRPERVVTAEDTYTTTGPRSLP